jgi:flagellar hook-associated protein FlgK
LLDKVEKDVDQVVNDVNALLKDVNDLNRLLVDHGLGRIEAGLPIP